jgi:SAM-dependent methyltransferase
VSCRYSEIERFYPDFKTHGGTLDADSEIFARLFSERMGSRGLEVGANKEPLAVALGSLGYDITGVDLRPYDPYEDAREYLRRLTFHQGDFLRLPFIPEQFDFAYSISTIEHIGLGAYGEETMPGGDGLAMRKIWSLLKPKGHAYITIPVGVSETDPRGWRVYDELDIMTKILASNGFEGGFTVCSRTFVAADIFGGHARGDYISSFEAFKQDGPQASCLLVLEKV